MSSWTDFDLGAGAIYLVAAKTDDERRRVLRAIGPVWGWANEVWLLAGGARFIFAFPLLYASSFSGFYLPLTMVLWLLILRGHWDGFARISTTRELAIFLRRGLQRFQHSAGCVFSGRRWAMSCAGFPLDATGYFFEPLWTNFRLGPRTGILDWYTVLIGVRGSGDFVGPRGLLLLLSRRTKIWGAERGDSHLLCWPLQFFLTFSTLIATYFIRPEIMDNYGRHKIGVLVPVVVVASLAVMPVGQSQGQREAGIPGFVCLHRGNAGGRRVCALSCAAAGSRRSI